MSNEQTTAIRRKDGSLIIEGPGTVRELAERVVRDRLSLRGANLTGANLRGAVLTGANLSRADLGGAYLGRADLGGADLGGAVLTDANLRRADLNGANLTGADLTGASLYGAYLHSTNLSGAVLTDADLTGANLRRANLNGANLRRADLSRAYLGGVAAVIDGGVPDGFRLVGWRRGGALMLRAGCRDLSPAEARERWTGRSRRRECLAALDGIEAVARLLGWQP